MSVYSTDFYESQRTGSRQSASVVLPRLFELISLPTSVLDVGCGVGTWLAEALRLGVSDVAGVDGDYVVRGDLQIPADCFHPRDLTSPFDLGRTFDLVMSLEVAEHLDEQYADTFVQSIAAHGDVVLFSAALPAQRGTHHVNERWPSYWVPKFEAHGYELFDVLRPQVWADDRVEFWYRQNVLIFARGRRKTTLRAAVTKAGLDRMPVLDVVHPGLITATQAREARELARTPPDWRLALRHAKRAALQQAERLKRTSPPRSTS